MKNNRCLFGIYALVVLLTIPLRSFADEPHTEPDYGPGPLQVRSQAPGSTLRLTMSPAVPEKIKPGGFCIRASGTWVNMYSHDLILLDYESLDMTITAGYGISDRLMINLSYDQRSFFGGTMDGLIEGWHDLFGFDNNERYKEPRDQSQIGIHDNNWNASELENSGISLNAQYTLHRGEGKWPSLGLNAVVRYSINTPFDDDENMPTDFGFGLGMTRDLSKRWHAFLNMSLTYFSQTRLLGLDMKKNAFSGIAGIAWQVWPSVAVLVQYLGTEGVFKKLGSLSKPSHEVDFGFKWRLTEGGIIEFGMVENIRNRHNSPDFGINLAYSHWF